MIQGLPDHQCTEVPRDAIGNISLDKVNTIAKRTTKAKKRKQIQDVFVIQTLCEHWEEVVDRYGHYAEDVDKLICIYFYFRIFVTSPFSFQSHTNHFILV